MRWWALGVLLATSCSTARLEMRGAPPAPFDAVVVPGCPTEADGSLSRCQMARAVWAARMWERGWAKNFITSGSAVYTPFVEAEALAVALVSLGVPADRIWLEPNALHTDENMVYSLQIARALGWRRLAVASNAAGLDCLMMEDWGGDCRAFELDLAWVKARHEALGRPLERVRAPRAAQFVPKAERERALAASSGRHRPPSYVLYLGLAFLRSNGEHWIPPGLPARAPLLNWAQRLATDTR
jgi:hypothetical protein